MVSPIDKSSRGSECESRDLPKQQALSCVGSFSNVVDSSTPLRSGRNDNGVTFLRIRPLFMQHFAPPRRPHQSRPRGEPASPEGSSCSVSAGLRLNLTEIYPEGSPERHTGRSLRFRWWVDSFNHTGYICNVAGGRLPPLQTHWWVVSFNRTGYMCNVPGTARRPFPTVLLVGVTVQPHRLYSKRCLAMNHRRYIAFTVRRNDCQDSGVWLLRSARPRTLRNTTRKAVNCTRKVMLQDKG